MLPSINQIVKVSADGGENYNLKSRVADISKGYISIEMPIDMDTGKFKVITVGSEIHGTFITSDHGQYYFESKVISIKKDLLPLLLIEIPKNFKKIQRREYLRVQTGVEVSFKEKEIDTDWFITKTIDISGGGMQIILPLESNKYIANTEVEGWLVLPSKNNNIDHIRFTGKILRVRLPYQDANVHWASVEFIKISENLREKLIRFCFDKQVEINKKMKGE